jgi:hypothetical protein
VGSSIRSSVGGSEFLSVVGQNNRSSCRSLPQHDVREDQKCGLAGRVWQLRGLASRRLENGAHSGAEITKKVPILVPSNLHRRRIRLRYFAPKLPPCGNCGGRDKVRQFPRKTWGLAVKPRDFSGLWRGQPTIGRVAKLADAQDLKPERAFTYRPTCPRDTRGRDVAGANSGDVLSRRCSWYRFSSDRVAMSTRRQHFPCLRCCETEGGS